MKNISLLVVGVIFTCLSVNAQNNAGKADDGARIAITPQVSDQNIPQASKKMLINKMKQICTKNGMSGAGENPFFVMDASVDVLTKDITPTAPPMQALTLSVNFEIKDNMSGNVYSQTSIEVKGVGKTETKAYMEAIKRINTNSGQFKSFVGTGKEKILEFYNSECDFIISKAKALNAQGQSNKAIKVLESVPSVSKECYDMCMELLAEIEPEQPAAATASSGGGSSSGSTAGTTGGGSVAMSSQEIDEGLFLVYTKSKVMGNMIKLYFQFENRGSSDYELNDYVYDTKILDASGAEKKLEAVYMSGTKKGSYIKATIINGTPIPVEFEFEKVNSISMFEFKYKNKVFRFKDIQLESSTSAPQASTVARAANTTPNMVIAGGKVLVEVNGGEFKWRKYQLGKVKTVASAQTKNEYEVMLMSGGDNIWTRDIVSKWHDATKNELKDGMLVLYAPYDDKEYFYPGYIVGLENLYKGDVTIKGRGENVNEVPIKRVVISDSGFAKMD